MTNKSLLNTICAAEGISLQRLLDMEARLGCVFCPDGEFAEMSQPLSAYQEKTTPIPHVRYDFYHGDMAILQQMVASVDEEWCQYFTPHTPVFCAYWDDTPVSFCIVDEDADCVLSQPGVKIGSIGCVGTVPAYRGHGIALRMVDLATVLLLQSGCNKGYISYTHIDHWYQKLGYRTFARFSFPE